MIREVLIKASFQVSKAEIAVPDISAFTKQMEAQNKLAEDQAKAIDELLARQQKRDQQAREEEQANAQRRQEEAKASEERRKADEETRQQKEEAARLEKEAAEAAKKAADEAAKAEKEKQDAINATNKAREEALLRERQISDALLKGGDALKQAGDGAFAFARGLTLIGFEGTESLEQVARAVASVQGKFDLFRGSIDLIKGGVESARAFGEAFDKAGGPVALLGTRFSAIAAFLGPQGLIAAGGVAAAAAIAAVYTSLGDETESAVQRAERLLQDFINRSERMRAQAINAFERDDAIRSRLSAEQQIASARDELGRLGDGRTFNVDAEQRERELANQRLEEIERQRAALTGRGPRGSTSRLDEERRSRLAQEAELLRNRLSIIDPEKRKSEIETELENARQRESLRGTILDQSDTRASSLDRERTAGIREAEQRLQEQQNKLTTAQENLAQAQAKREEEERRAAAERGRLAAPQRAFVDRVSGDLSDPSTTKAQLDRLAQLLPTAFGQKVRDEFTRRETGVAVTREDEVAKLQETIKSFQEGVAEAAKTLSGRNEEDSRLDAAAAAEREANLEAFKTSVEATKALKDQLDNIISELRQQGG